MGSFDALSFQPVWRAMGSESLLSKLLTCLSFMETEDLWQRRGLTDKFSMLIFRNILWQGKFLCFGGGKLEKHLSFSLSEKWKYFRPQSVIRAWFGQNSKQRCGRILEKAMNSSLLQDPLVCFVQRCLFHTAGPLFKELRMYHLQPTHCCHLPVLNVNASQRFPWAWFKRLSFQKASESSAISLPLNVYHHDWSNDSSPHIPRAGLFMFFSCPFLCALLLCFPWKPPPPLSLSLLCVWGGGQSKTLSSCDFTAQMKRAFHVQQNALRANDGDIRKLLQQNHYQEAAGVHFLVKQAKFPG